MTGYNLGRAAQPQPKSFNPKPSGLGVPPDARPAGRACEGVRAAFCRQLFAGPDGSPGLGETEDSGLCKVPSSGWDRSEPRLDSASGDRRMRRTRPAELDSAGPCLTATQHPTTTNQSPPSLFRWVPA